MAEGYIAEECMTMCSMYMNEVETQFNKMERNYNWRKQIPQDSLFVFSEDSHLIGKGIYECLDDQSFKQVHSYVLKNSDEILPFIGYFVELFFLPSLRLTSTFILLCIYISHIF